MADNRDLEKNYSGNHQHLGANTKPDNALRQMKTAGSISLSPELFEKLYLSPPNPVKGELRKTFGNPTPMAVIGFLLCATPASMDLMGWRGATTSGAATTGWDFYCGGLLMILGSIGEWILGNTFSFVVFGTFGAYWLGYATTLVPSYNASGAYRNPQDPSSTGLESKAFNVGVGYYLLSMAMACLAFLICSVRTNLLYCIKFFTLTMVFSLSTVAYMFTATGNVAVAGKLQEAAGACLFVTIICGWYIFFSILLASVDFPFNLPLFDLSGVVKGASDRNRD